MTGPDVKVPLTAEEVAIISFALGLYAGMVSPTTAKESLPTVSALLRKLDNLTPKLKGTT